MKVYVVHNVEECDSDTGADTYFMSRIYGVFESYKKVVAYIVKEELSATIDAFTLRKSKGL